MVFEQTAPGPEPVEPVPPHEEVPPEPPPPTAPTVETPPAEPEQTPPQVPALVSPPEPELEPAPTLPPPEPKPVQKAAPRLIPPKVQAPRSVAKVPEARPAPQARPVDQAAIGAPVTPPAPVAPSAPVVDPAWQAAVSSWLAARKIYPEEARRRGEEGRVAVRFTVDRSGHVVDATAVTASGSALLDEAALRLLRQAVLPAFPAAMTEARVTITTTIRYSLR